MSDNPKAEAVSVASSEPYPTGTPMTEEERFGFLQSVHSPQELVQAVNWDEVNTLNLAAGGSVDQAELSSQQEEAHSDLPPLAITSPAAGSTVGPLAPIKGVGATEGADVNLMFEGTVIDTVNPGADGSFIFIGTTPMSLGEVTLTVECDGETSPPVTFTVEEES